MKGEVGMIAACAGSDRRRLEVTVGAQVMTDDGKGGQEGMQEDNRSREGYRRYVQEMRGEDRESTESDGDDEDFQRDREF